MCLGDSACVLIAEGLLQRKDNKKGRIGFVIKAKESGAVSLSSVHASVIYLHYTISKLSTPQHKCTHRGGYCFFSFYSFIYLP